MNFDFSDDDKLIADQVSRLLREQCGTDVVRQVLEGQAVYSEPLWREVSAMGLQGTAVPSSFGGADAGYLALCLVAQEMGRAVAPIPFSSSVYLASEALLVSPDAALQSAWLPRLVAGEVIGTLAVTEGTSQLTPQEVTCTVTDGRLHGKKLIVADGGIADVAVVLARQGDDLGLFLVELDEATVHRETLATVDPTRNSATLTFDGAPATPVVAEDGWSALANLYDRAAVLLAFEQIGGAAAALDMAVAYANERFAFGRPIGSFQGLKHMMADMYVALKLAESNCYYAAWALAANAPELPLAAATARVSATQAAQVCASDNIQVHGGMGFTWEFDCHLYYRRSNYLALQLGGVTEWQNKLVDALPEVAA